MKLVFHKKFSKAYIKLSPKLQIKVDKTIILFRENPFLKNLGNHKLQDTLKGKRSISVTGDIRIIFEEYKNYTIVEMLHVGKHTQVYKKF
jgi:mRNA-degrading endonuclease YafQ of YafQ-DinJ toxin-antitoxin module